MGKKRVIAAIFTGGFSEVANLVTGGAVFPAKEHASDPPAVTSPAVTKADPTITTEDPNVKAEQESVRRRLRAKAGRMGTLLALDDNSQSGGGLKTKLGE